MAAFDHIHNMHDNSLKPNLLRSLIKQHIPDEKHPFRSPVEMSRVVSIVKTHRLLSEPLASDSMDRKQIDNWMAAIDAWVNRLLLLVSCNMPDKSWAGICLLGVTCQECSSKRFLSSYSLWFHKILLHIQPPSDSYFVKVASCAAMSDLFTRLSGFPKEKKDGTSHAVKLIQPVLKLLNEDSSDAVWEGAICLLCTILTFFPSSIHRCYDSVEASIVSKIMSGNCSASMLKKLGHCLALLPRSRGDEDSWSLMMHQILVSINILLNNIFQGLEEETKSHEAMRVLVPSGKDPPPPLGGHTMLKDASNQSSKIPQNLMTSSVSALMICCCTMLTSSYPAQVVVPVRPLLTLVRRVLMVDGSLSQSLLPFMTVRQQEFICSELPILHLYTLELLTAVVKGVHCQILPHVADIMRILTEYFRRCVLPDLRIKLYSIIRILLTSMGVGIVIYLTQDVIDNAIVDLDSAGCESGGKSSTAYSKDYAGAFLHPHQKKRKHAATIVSHGEQPDVVGLEPEALENHPQKSLKIAALEALETLLTVGGALRSESWRSNIDHLLISVARYAFKGGWAKEQKDIFLASEPTASWADFQLAALRALLASLLSPGRVRPPYLAQGLELFRRGVQETGTKLAEFCSHALLALEVLIHPRALPQVDFQSAHDNPFDGINNDIYSGFQKQKTSFASGALGKGPNDPDSDDDMYLYENEMDAPTTDSGKNTKYETVIDPLTEKLLSGGGSTGRKIPEEIEDQTAAVEGVNNEANRDEIMTELQQFQEPIGQPQDRMVLADASGPSRAQLGSFVLDSGVLDPDSEMAPGKDALAAGPDAVTRPSEITSAALSNSERGKGFMLELDNDSSTDSFPDIVDEPPDSDVELSGD